MGFFSSLLNVALSGKANSSKTPPVEVVISYDSNWFDAWESLRIKQEQQPFEVDLKVSFDENLLKEIWTSIEEHTATPRILYDEDQQPINNVGESYRQQQIAEFCGEEYAEEIGWLAGFLVPEMANPHDKTAVAIYAMKPSDDGIESEIPFKLLHGGYMDRESAKKVHKKILNLMGKDQFIPLLVRIQGGTADRPNYGVFAYAKTKAIKFP
jgi:hypothetical protein